jgi:long-chain acyl-CoA synthetase
MNEIDTLPKSLISAYKKYGDGKTAMRQKDMGLWRSFTWEESYRQVRKLSLGLIMLGLKRGDKICIIGDNDPQYFWAQLAIQVGGGVAVGIFTDSSPAEVEYIVNHCDAVLVFAKDQEQCDKLLDIHKQLPKVRQVIYWEDKGLWNYDQPWLMSYEHVQTMGERLDEEKPNLFNENIDLGLGDDLAIFCYTSGTTDLPKGAMITHTNLISGCDQTLIVDPRSDAEEYLSFLPPAWITENVLGLTIHLRTGMVVNFPEAPETVQDNIREITPSSFLFSARLWENMMSIVQIKMADTSPINQFLYRIFMPVGYKIANLRYEQKKTVGMAWRLLNTLGEITVFQPLRDKFGLTNVISAYSSGAALNPEVIRFFRAIGVNIKQLYGSTEANVHTLHVGDDVKFETVGVPAPGQNIKITEESEIIISGATVFQGYYKNPEATEKALRVDEQGNAWFYTGDAGYFDQDGHLIYMDRVSEMINLGSNEKFSPQYIEGQLKFSPYIRDVMTLGGEDKPYVTALINIEFDNVGRWTEKQGIPYTTFVDLSQRPEVYELISEDVKRVNRYLPQPARIHKYVLLHKEFDADEGELTRTRKLRRNLLSERYEEIITTMYTGGDSVKVHATVKYRDGRESTTETAIRIATLQLKDGQL